MDKISGSKIYLVRLALGILSMMTIAGAFESSLAQTRRSGTSARRVVSIPRGTEMKIRLENEIDSKKSQNGDRFTAVVLSPRRYADATIEGHVAKIDSSGKVSGRTELSLSFDRIRLTNGDTGRMGAQVVRVYDGKSADRVDEEGNVRSGSQGKETAVRGAGGAALGAIIGGIAGGGKGAAIGAAAGAGAGAGSVLITGSKKVKLESGTEVLIRTTR